MWFGGQQWAEHLELYRCESSVGHLVFGQHCSSSGKAIGLRHRYQNYMLKHLSSVAVRDIGDEWMILNIEHWTFLLNSMKTSLIGI